MLTLQKAQRDAAARQGCQAAVFAELQRGDGSGEVLSGTGRQRLLELTRRLRRVQALGGEYARVELSPHVQDRLRSS